MPAYARPPRRHAVEGEPDDDRPSRTQLKAQMLALQELGQALCDMPAQRLAQIAMPEALRDAIAQMHHTRSHEGRRRQLQFIGKQMRAADEAPLREAVATFKLGSARDTLRLHLAEHWRDQMVLDDAAVTRWATEFAASDLQQLRSLVRAARSDAAKAPEQRNGRGYRALFQFIKPWLEESAPDSAAGVPADLGPDDFTNDDASDA